MPRAMGGGIITIIPTRETGTLHFEFIGFAVLILVLKKKKMLLLLLAVPWR
jgi:hypothetical protein